MEMFIRLQVKRNLVKDGLEKSEDNVPKWLEKVPEGLPARRPVTAWSFSVSENNEKVRNYNYYNVSDDARTRKERKYVIFLRNHNEHWKASDVLKSPCEFEIFRFNVESPIPIG